MGTLKGTLHTHYLRVGKKGNASRRDHLRKVERSKSRPYRRLSDKAPTRRKIILAE